jgi:hypothetical protein
MRPVVCSQSAQDEQSVSGAAAAGQAAAIATPTDRQPTSEKMLRSLDSSFGFTIWQRAPARTCTSMLSPNRSLAPSGALHHTDAPRPAPSAPCRHGTRRGRPERLTGRKASPQRDHPIEHLVAGRGANPGVVDRSKTGRPRATRSADAPTPRTQQANNQFTQREQSQRPWSEIPPV